MKVITCLVVLLSSVSLRLTSAQGCSGLNGGQCKKTSGCVLDKGTCYGSTPTPPPPTPSPPPPTPECDDAPPASQFNIQLVNIGPPDTPQNIVDAFTEAKARWESIILNDLPDIANQNPGFDWFGNIATVYNPYNEAVDDVVIGYAIQYIDGPGKILGSAGPRYTRYDGSPISGTMKFDIDDFTSGFFSDEDIKVIILHEMGR
jgi:hypothetical protein